MRVSLAYLCYWLVSLERVSSREWFERIPDENLKGVPKAVLDTERNWKTYRKYWSLFVGRTGKSEGSIRAAQRLRKVQKRFPKSATFPCDVRNGRSTERPESVHKLRPGDIDVVAAMGDSLTIGNGAFASGFFQVTVENRGVSSIIGGQGDWQRFLTLPNILKLYNPNLVGYSRGDSLTFEKDSQFNLAEIGAMSKDMPFMARVVVNRIKRDPRVDFENDWKLLTIFIGGNNFCFDLCYVPNVTDSIQEHKEDLIKTFSYLRDNMPRTVVNLILIPNLSILFSMKNIPYICTYWRPIECPCLFALLHRPKRKSFTNVMSQWQRVEKEVVDDDRFKIKDDFAVNLMPFMENVRIPNIRRNGQASTDLSYFSLDCFHFSQKGYSSGKLNNVIYLVL